jgi:queuosine precursor transporter
MANLNQPEVLGDSTRAAGRTYQYYDLIMASFVAVLLCANLVGVSKIATVAGFTFGAGNIFFPISYLFGDVLTEVYGYARSRKVVWAGFGALAYASLMAFVVVHLPAAEGWKGQEHLEAVFGNTWRTALASLLGYACGEFGNSFTLAKLKVLTQGRFLWMRTIGSTIVGEAIDTLVFYPLAFFGQWETDLLLKVMLANYGIKVAWEILATPITYRVVNFLKRKENEDFYDKETDFTPFSLKT